MTSTCLPSPYTLVRLADCSEPSDHDTPGARFLLGIAEHVAERAGDDDDRHDLAHEVADAAIPPYTVDIWAVFVDLQGWHEDTRDLGDDGGDLTRSATLALFMIGERLAAALLHDEQG